MTVLRDRGSVATPKDTRRGRLNSRRRTGDGDLVYRRGRRSMMSGSGDGLRYRKVMYLSDMHLSFSRFAGGRSLDVVWLID